MPRGVYLYLYPNTPYLSIAKGVRACVRSSTHLRHLIVSLHEHNVSFRFVSHPYSPHGHHLPKKYLLLSIPDPRPNPYFTSPQLLLDNARIFIGTLTHLPPSQILEPRSQRPTHIVIFAQNPILPVVVQRVEFVAPPTAIVEPFGGGGRSAVGGVEGVGVVVVGVGVGI